MHLQKRLSAFAALFAFLFLAAAPAKAQAIFSIGSGSFLSANQQDTLHSTYWVSQSPNGHVQGYWLFNGPNSTQLIDISSVMLLPDGSVAFAGTIVMIIGNPPGGAVVGQTAFTAFRDNGWGAVDETASFSVVPAAYGNPTIQQIVALVGPPVFRPLVTGNVWIL